MDLYNRGRWCQQFHPDLEVRIYICLVGCWSFTSLQLLRSYQDGYLHVIVHPHGDFIVLLHWEIRPPAMTRYTTKWDYSDNKCFIMLIWGFESTWPLKCTPVSSTWVSRLNSIRGNNCLIIQRHSYCDAIYATDHDQRYPKCTEFNFSLWIPLPVYKS